MSSLQPGVEEPKPSSSMSNGGASAAGGTKDNAELRGGFVLKSRSDEAPVRRRSLVERTGMKNLMQVNIFFPLAFKIFFSILMIVHQKDADTVIFVCIRN